VERTDEEIEALASVQPSNVNNESSPVETAIAGKAALGRKILEETRIEPVQDNPDPVRANASCFILCPFGP
jgi:hypothetical protein